MLSSLLGDKGHSEFVSVWVMMYLFIPVPTEVGKPCV